MDRPVYFVSRGKDVSINYNYTKRYGCRKTLLSSFNANEIQEAENLCKDWEEKERQLWKLGSLRYKKKVSDFPQGKLISLIYSKRLKEFTGE